MIILWLVSLAVALYLLVGLGFAFLLGMPTKGDLVIWTFAWLPILAAFAGVYILIWVSAAINHTRWD